MTAWCRKVAEKEAFQSFIISVIVFNAVVIGLETSRGLMAAYGWLFHLLNLAVQAIFIFEIAVRMLAHWPRTSRFFRDGWNVFDFTVVALSLLPVAGPFATVARLARVARMTRLVSVSPNLRLIVDTMLRSIPSMAHVVTLLAVVLYVYAILGYYLFAAVAPAHWGGLGTALLSLFQILTLEGWNEMQQATMAVHSWSWVYFVSFIVIAVFVTTNLFIAVLINNFQSVKSEQAAGEQAQNPAAELLHRVEQLRQQLDNFAGQLRSLEHRRRMQRAIATD